MKHCSCFLEIHNTLLCGPVLCVYVLILNRRKPSIVVHRFRFFIFKTWGKWYFYFIYQKYSIIYFVRMLHCLPETFHYTPRMFFFLIRGWFCSSFLYYMDLILSLHSNYPSQSYFDVGNNHNFKHLHNSILQYFFVIVL